MQLLRAGVCDRNPKDYLHKPETYSLEQVDVKQLLQISPRVNPLDRVPLRSERGVDYTRLRELLRAQQWREADQETRQVMLKATQREKQGYLNVSDIEQFPCPDLQTIDQLWEVASGGKFGFSVQKKIYVETGNPLDGKYHKGTFEKFGDRVGWRVNNNWLVRVAESRYQTDIEKTRFGHFPGPPPRVIYLPEWERGPAGGPTGILSSRALAGGPTGILFSRALPRKGGRAGVD